MKKITALAAAIAAFVIVAAAPAYADSVSGVDGPRDVGAKSESIGIRNVGATDKPMGKGGPDYSKPSPKPERSDFDSNAEYAAAVTSWRASESARIANLNAGRD